MHEGYFICNVNVNKCFFILATILLFACNPKRKSESNQQISDHQVGSSMIKIRMISNGNSGYAFVNLHDNEITAESAVLKIISEKGGNFLKIENNRKRNIQFELGNRQFEFDPNRIFTERGRSATLKKNGNYYKDAEKRVEGFANAILEKLSDFKHIIAVHNNTNDHYSINDYKDKLKNDVRSLHINENMDRDNFIFTTNEVLFRKLKAQNINAVLQNNSTVTDDGSLSVYAGRKGRSYVNIETEHNELYEQQRLIVEVIKILEN
jgi:hypothetical protein